MKILIDMNLAPAWCEFLQNDGISAIHWSEIGLGNAPDSTIMAYAAENKFVVLTHDLDFGIAVAMSNQDGPSVAQIRGEDLRFSSIGRQVVYALRQMQTELERGALLTIDPQRVRVRYLPLRER
ncbi:Predicted nuclease, contains PIN domain, potential toxin-antitoxin system component [Granulicella rosea]|uniref:Predicted nuclease, contains PIN domain, potential toxin-antitoxin system component n=1 Tax=Granulicella rosea TaxID=474952 RepID=A0A239CQ52_9BACT|nr:DUF5615 family PIN-like protein [Granulicella rosea]SNS21801.1 Predicted nuclease, contains PIN domain, potential toxin-antitoxin system component [Granulicella rosea]